MPKITSFAFNDQPEETAPKRITSFAFDRPEDDRWEVTKGLSSGIDQTQGLGYGLAALAADAVGSDTARDWAMEGYERNMQEAQANAPRVQQLEQIEGVGDAADWAMGTLGQLAPTIATMVVTGGIGGAIGKQVAQKGVREFIENRAKNELKSGAVNKLASRTAAKAATKGQMGGVVAGSVGMETGEIYGDVASEGAEGAGAILSSLAGGTLAGALEALPVIRIGKRFGFAGELEDKILSKLANYSMPQRVATEAGKQAVAEGSTEAVQTAIEEATKAFILERDLPEDIASMMMNAAAAGALGGSVMGGVGGIPSRQAPVQPTPIKPKQVGGILGSINPNAGLTEPAPTQIYPTVTPQAPLPENVVQYERVQPETQLGGIETFLGANQPTQYDNGIDYTVRQPEPIQAAIETPVQADSRIRQETPPQALERPMADRGTMELQKPIKEVKREAVPEMPQRASEIAQILPGLPQSIYAGMEKIASSKGRAKEKRQLQELFGRVSEAGQDPKTAMQEMWGEEFSNAPPGLRKAVVSGMAVPEVPPIVAQEPTVETTKPEPIENVVAPEAVQAEAQPITTENAAVEPQVVQQEPSVTTEIITEKTEQAAAETTQETSPTSSQDAVKQQAKQSVTGGEASQEGVILQLDGSPYKTEKVARRSATLRKSTKGKEIEVVPVRGGFGIKVSSSTPKAAEKRGASSEKPIIVAAETQSTVTEATTPSILDMTKQQYVSSKVKELGIKRKSMGYDAAVSRIEDEYETDLDKAYANLPFEEFHKRNSPASMDFNRQAYDQLREEYGVDSSPEAKISPRKTKAKAELEQEKKNDQEVQGQEATKEVKVPRETKEKAEPTQEKPVEKKVQTAPAAEEKAPREERLRPRKTKPRKSKDDVSFSAAEKSNIERAVDLWREIGRSDDAFQYPTSNKTTMQGIAADTDPAIKITEMGEDVRFPNTWKIAVSSGDTTYKGHLIQNKDGTLELNVAGFTSGKSKGAAVYHIVSTFAHNNGLVFKGDTSGLSDTAVIRRTENMLSSALKYGTTDHLLPHERQEIDWQPGNTQFNLEKLLEKSYNNIKKGSPLIEDIVYDFDLQDFTSKETGRRVTESQFRQLSNSAGARSVNAGPGTLKRAALTNTFLKSEGKKDGGKILAQLARQLHADLDPSLVNILYSKGTGSGISVQEVRQAIDPITTKWGQGDVKVVDTFDKLPKHIQTQSGTIKVKGAYDRQSQKMYLVADQLINAVDAQKTLAHEAIGHYSMEEMLGDKYSDILDEVQTLKAKNKRVGRIAAEVGRRYGELNRNQESAEIIAVMAENGIRNALMKRIYAIVRKFLRDLGFKPMFSVTELEGMISQARARLRGKKKAGTAIPGDLQPAFAKADPTDSQAFKDWFGDSKVVDEDGKPLVVYHGTDSVIDEFSGSFAKEGPSKFGFWMTAQKDFAEAFGGTQMPLYLQITNPKVITTDKWNEIRDEHAKDGDWFEQWKNSLQKDGYDGLVVKGSKEMLGKFEVTNPDIYAVFDPTQIKSVNNQGTFDPNDSRIMFSAAERDSAFIAENQRLREEDRPLWEKAKKILKRNFSPGGLLPSAVFDEKIIRDSEFDVVEFDVRHLVGRLEKSVKTAYGQNFENLNQDVVDTLGAALGGKVDQAIPDIVRQEVYAMRQYVDKLSGEYAAILNSDIKRLTAEGSPEAIEKAALLETITGNIGTYINRSYRAFDDKTWFRRIPDDVLDSARKYLISRYIENGKSRAEAKRLAEVTMHEIVKTGTAYDSMESFIKESKLGAKDLSVLKKRKQIDPAIRALLGEYTDPRMGFAKSATKMGRLIWNQKFLDRVREIGMGEFLFEGSDRPPEATKQFAADGSEAYAPLNGLWTYPEVEQAFRDSIGKEQMADWYRTIVQMNGMVKYGKTILSPTTAMRNWQSAMFFSLANGHFDMRHAAKSLSGLREYFTQQGEGSKLEYLKKMKRLGVVYDTPYAGEMMRLLDDSRIEDMLKGKKGKSVSAMRWMLKNAQKFYQYGDDFWKIIGFENEKAILIKHGKMSVAEAEKEAAARIRNTYPTYSLVGKAMQSLRRFPLAGTFVSFPAEIIRTSINIVKYIAKDMKTPGMRPVAIRRATGLAIASGFAYALQELMKTVVGVDDDEEEAVRQLAAPWQKNSNLVFTDRKPNGELRYIDISFVDPYNYWKRPMTAVMRDQDWKDSAYDVIKETLTPFLGTDIAAGTIFEILANKRSGSGAPVYSEHDHPWEVTKDITNHLRKSLQPGFVSNVERTMMAMKGEKSSSGRAYNAFDEAMAWGGWRVSTLDPKVALYYRSYDFKDAKRDATKKLNRVLRDPNEVTDGDLRSAWDLSVEMRAQAYKDMEKIIHAAQKSGLSPIKIRSILRKSGITKRDVASLMNGVTPHWVPSSASLNNAIKKAGVLFDKETAVRFRQRYQEVRGFNRQSP